MYIYIDGFILLLHKLWQNPIIIKAGQLGQPGPAGWAGPAGQAFSAVVTWVRGILLDNLMADLLADENNLKYIVGE